MILSLKLFHAGYCTHKESITIKDGSSKIRKFPAMFACIKHKTNGYILYDTGYSYRFFEETKRFPFNIYPRITPVFFNESNSAIHQLEKCGISCDDIKYIIISHFHADHISGLKDFPNAQLICSNSAFTSVCHKTGLRAIINGFIPKLLPADFNSRIQFVENFTRIDLPSSYFPYTHGYDLFGDNSLLAVILAGHVNGQVGAFVNQSNETSFLIGDAAWLSRSYEQNIPPHPLANIIMYSKKAYLKTLQNIHDFYLNNPNVRIVPSHCDQFWTEKESG